MSSPNETSLDTAWFSIRAIGYLFAATVVMFYLDVNLNPPGFTGHSLFAIAIIPFGSYRLARDCRSKAFFFIFGCVGAAPILVLFFGEAAVFSWTEDAETAWRYIAASIGFLLAVGIVSLYFATKRWQTGIGRMGYCAVCGYDLRATPERCPECGTIPPKKELISN